MKGSNNLLEQKEYRRKTKIVCTLGPACEKESIMESMIAAGMDVARFNFSHGDHEEQSGRLKTIRKLSEKTGKYIACLLDTKGPEIRTGSFREGQAELVTGESFTLTTRDVEGDSACVSVTYKDLPKDVKKGDCILIDDGLVELQVLNTTKTDIVCKVINGGIIGNKKGINVPGVVVTLPYISQKDRADIIFGVENDYDFIAASFTRSANDLLEIRQVLEEAGNDTIKIIAKIENAQGVANIDEILHVSDGIMVARGDMGVEIPLEEVPILQKQLIKKAYRAGKIVITATQMLDSMIVNPRPTRAETTDVATAIYDGTSAIMLSGETANGHYPVESVLTMARIAIRAEQDIDYKIRFLADSMHEQFDVTNAISHAACEAAYDLNAAAIIAVTETGLSARLISKYRPAMPIVACSPHKKTLRQMNMSWGVVPVELEEKIHSEDLFNCAVKNAMAQDLLENGDMVVITAGLPLGISGTTNLLRVHIVGDVLIKGTGIGNLCVCAPLCVVNTEVEARKRFQAGDILVIPKTSNHILDLMKRAAGIVTEEDGLDSHAAIVGLTLDKPVLVGAVGATRILRDGTIVKLDAGAGMVRRADHTNEEDL